MCVTLHVAKQWHGDTADLNAISSRTTDNCYMQALAHASPEKLEFHYADFPLPKLSRGNVSRTQIMKRGRHGKVSGIQTTTTCGDACDKGKARDK